jgi:hypothetical protein
LHAGVLPLQLASEVHPPQVFVVVLQIGVDPPHCPWLVAVHWTQVLVVVLQAGVLPLQLASELHWTQPPAARLQTPLAAPQSSRAGLLQLLLEQVPARWKWVLSVHAAAAQSVLRLHATQPLVGLHLGVEPLHATCVPAVQLPEALHVWGM